MNKFDVLFDIKCLDSGLPPLSRSRPEVIEMIIKAPKEERRKISRKIRKLTKAALKSPHSRFDPNDPRILEHFGFLGKKNIFCIKVLERRIALITKHIQNHDELRNT
jgi:hypothetical protein